MPLSNTGNADTLSVLITHMHARNQTTVFYCMLEGEGATIKRGENIREMIEELNIYKRPKRKQMNTILEKIHTL